MFGGNNRLLSTGIFLVLLYISIQRVGGEVTPFNLIVVLGNLLIYVVILNVAILGSKSIQNKINKKY